MKRIFCLMLTGLMLLGAVFAESEAPSSMQNASPALQHRPHVTDLVGILDEICPQLFGEIRGVCFNSQKSQLLWGNDVNSLSLLCDLEMYQYDPMCVSKLSMMYGTEQEAESIVYPLLLALQMAEGKTLEEARIHARQLMNAVILPWLLQIDEIPLETKDEPLDVTLWGIPVKLSKLKVQRKTKIKLVFDFSDDNIPNVRFSPDVVSTESVEYLNTQLGLPDVIHGWDDLIPFSQEELLELVKQATNRISRTSVRNGNIRTVTLTMPVEDEDGTVRTVTVTLKINENTWDAALESSDTNTVLDYYEWYGYEDNLSDSLVGYMWDYRSLQPTGSNNPASYVDLPFECDFAPSAGRGMFAYLTLPSSVLHTADGTEVLMQIETVLGYLTPNTPSSDITEWQMKYTLTLPEGPQVQIVTDESGNLSVLLIRIGSKPNNTHTLSFSKYPTATIYLSDYLEENNLDHRTAGDWTVDLQFRGYINLSVSNHESSIYRVYMIIGNSYRATTYSWNPYHGKLWYVFYDDAHDIYTWSVFPEVEPLSYILNVDWQE